MSGVTSLTARRLEYAGLMTETEQNAVALDHIRAAHRGDPPGAWLTVGEVAEHFGIGIGWVRSQIRYGAPYALRGKRRYLDPDLFLRWVTDNGGGEIETSPPPLARTIDEPGWLDIVRLDPCAYCGDTQQHFDHIEPRALGGADSWQNITAACRRCNGRKHAQPLLTFLLAEAQ